MGQLAAAVPFIAVGLLFFLLIIRPAQRRSRELRALQSSLKVGDEVILTSGIYGTLVQHDDEIALLDIADGVTIKVARGAIGAIALKPGFDDVEPEEN